MDAPITTNELTAAIMRAPKNKSPGLDGIIAEFYKWGHDIIKEDLLNMYNGFLSTGSLPSMYKQGIIVCLPKKASAHTLNDYRPLTLLNTDYKIYARILDNRIKPTLKDVLHASQYSVEPGLNIYDATAAIRDIIALETQKKG
jgi:hypothetical protein